VARPYLGGHASDRIPGPVQHGLFGGRWRDLLRPVVGRLGMPLLFGFVEAFRDAELDVGEDMVS
jgi:hypothetical protein